MEAAAALFVPTVIFALNVPMCVRSVRAPAASATPSAPIVTTVKTAAPVPASLSLSFSLRMAKWSPMTAWLRSAGRPISCPEDWWLWFPKHHAVILPPTNQKKVHELITHPATLIPNFALKKKFLSCLSHFYFDLS